MFYDGLLECFFRQFTFKRKNTLNKLIAVMAHFQDEQYAKQINSNNDCSRLKTSTLCEVHYVNIRI